MLNYLSHDIKIIKKSHFCVKMQVFAIFYTALKWTPLRIVT